MYYVYNGQGNISQLFYINNTLAVDYTYDAFGYKSATNEDVYNPFRYNGEYYDEETGYTYLRNRYYDSDKGRFINEDPIKNGLNWYAYCENNPIMLVDPDGLMGRNTVLMRGRTNNSVDVQKLQRELNARGYYGRNGGALAVDGKSGRDTEFAVKKFQQDSGLTVDGKVGKNTWSALGLSFNADYERTTQAGTPETYSEGFAVRTTNPSLSRSGLSLAGFESLLTRMGQEYKYASWSITCVEGKLEAGISSSCIGIDSNLSLVKVNGSLEIPIPYTNRKLVVGGDGILGGVGFTAMYDPSEGKTKIGVTALVGKTLSVSIK